MTEIKNYSKEAFIRFVICTSDFISSSKDQAVEYLKSEGLNADAIIANGVKEIKRLQLKINAERIKSELINAQALKLKATEWVNNLLSDISFSFPEFVKKENLVLHNRNIESLAPEDIKDTLIQYFTLKFLESEKGKSK